MISISQASNVGAQFKQRSHSHHNGTVYEDIPGIHWTLSCATECLSKPSCASFSFNKVLYTLHKKFSSTLCICYFRYSQVSHFENSWFHQLFIHVVIDYLNQKNSCFNWKTNKRGENFYQLLFMCLGNRQFNCCVWAYIKPA